MEWIDTHAHLFDERFADDLPQVLDTAAANGVSRILMPAIDSSAHGAMIRLAQAHPGRCLAMIGLHPTSVNDNPAYRAELDMVENLLKNPPVTFHAIGEIGLDLYWSTGFLKEQEEALRRQIDLSIEYRLPVVFHTRESYPQLLGVLKSYDPAQLKGVFHSFSGSYDDYLEIERSGDFLIGVGGPVTYKKSALPEILKKIPLERIVLETDAPYLPPEPHRGRRNESGYIPLIGARVADIMGVPATEVARITTQNAARMFGI